MTFQIKALLNEWHPRCDSTEWVLGTVYKTEGPCYRKPGAMMLFNGDGEQFGLLSGGCLEVDIQQRARRVMQSGRASELCYDGSDEDDISFQLGIGCGGSVYVVLLPITRENHYLHLREIHQALSRRESSIFQIKIPDENGEIATRVIQATDGCTTNKRTQLLSEEGAKWLSVSVDSDTHILVIGGGVDARPMVSLAGKLGWEVTLWDSRPANARREYFMSANTILNCSVEELGHYATKQKVDAVILMTHNIALDAASLKALSDAPLKYLGLLGPTIRKQRVMEAANLVDSQIRTEVAGPAGFDLGGELPEAIALSIVAECHAHINGHSGRSVSRKM
ncbi:MAG: xanthine dehydrogenase accessory factor [Granulosicoccus sp.]|jgi:xanthine dehydrogenase accessory factor